MTNSILTSVRLRELLNYDANTGIFTRLTSRRGARIGSVSGTLNKRDRSQIIVDGCAYKSHRLVWLYIHGYWPKKQIDHINGVNSDNRLVNLRDVSQAINLQNQRKPRSDNTTGFLGVTWDKERKKFKAQISLDGKRHHIGRFDSAELACAAYIKAKRVIHKEGCTI